MEDCAITDAGSERKTRTKDERSTGSPRQPPGRPTNFAAITAITISWSHLAMLICGGGAATQVWQIRRISHILRALQKPGP